MIISGKPVTTTGKKVVRLDKSEYARIQRFGKLKRMLAWLKNKVTVRQGQILSLSNNVRLDDSKTEYKIEYLSFEPAEYVYGEQLVATVIACANPPACDFVKLALEFPEAYMACVKANGQHLRLNLKK